MINQDIKIAWVVDPGGPGYNPNFGPKIVEWLQQSPIQFAPSGRYYILLETPNLIWDGYKFYIGVESEEDADAFREKWGGMKAQGTIENGHFILSTEPHWLPRPENWND